MAARKRRENGPQRQSQREQLSSSDEMPVDIKEDPDEFQGTFQSSNSGMSMGQMSLDVLAQVATETLQNEPKSETESPPRKITKRSVQSLDLLSLEQIRLLSEKALVNMFAEMSSNEMTRNYTYTCVLMPSKCKDTFTSFGNENRARMLVRAHLLGHLGELLEERESGETSGRMKFTAEPLPARRKRIAAELSAQKKLTNKWAKQKKGQAPKNVKPTGRKSSTDEGYTNIKSGADKSAKKPARRAEDSGSTWVDNTSSECNTSGTNRKPVSKRPSTKKTGPNYVGRNPRLRVGLNRKNDQAKNPPAPAAVTAPTSAAMPAILKPDKPGERDLEENEQLIIDLLSRSQPFMDHNYTTIFGKRAIHENYYLDLEMSDLEDEDKAARSSGKRLKTFPDLTMASNDPTGKTLTLKVNAGSVPNINNVHIPIIRLARIPVAPDGTPLVSAEEVVVQENDAVEEIMRKHNLGATNAMRPYPPMPKSELARRGKVVVPEEEMSSSEEEETVELPPKRTRETRRVIEGSAEWERKMALKCIRELRCKKKEATLLLCKICRDKSFTATATLMYHYRSHAGIKPFVCLICNTTFTRQHSLNYHMLIHNNQSRFTCKDCGRKFRHPSHFKEHLRRHTGETPFHCTDCPLRFKTRNTYKRHLKTRHGKLLTAKGIRQMAFEDYLKVRSKRDKHQGEMISEEEDIEEEDEDIDDEEEEEEVEPGEAESNSSTTTENNTTAAEGGGGEAVEGVDPPNRLLQFCRQVAQVS